MKRTASIKAKQDELAAPNFYMREMNGAWIFRTRDNLCVCRVLSGHLAEVVLAALNAGGGL